MTDALLESLYREANIVRGKGEAFAAMRKLLEGEVKVQDCEVASMRRPVAEACPACKSTAVTTIYRPEAFEFRYFCRACERAWN